MTDADDPVLALSYAANQTRKPRKLSKPAVVMFIIAVAAAPTLLVLGLLAAERGLLPHDAVCPSCGAFGATLAVAFTGSLLVSTGVVLIRTVRAAGSAASIVLVSLAVVLAAVQSLLAVGFHFAIQR